MLASPKRSAALSGSLHAGAIALVLLITSTKTPPVSNLQITPLVHDIGRYISLVPRRTEGGGGGGTRDDTRASKGRLPRAALRQYTPPEARPLNLDPRLSMEATIIASPDATMPVDLTLIGDPNGVLGKLSNGGGTRGGIGEGDGGGIGNRRGPGAGPEGDGGGISGTTRPRGAFTRPLLIAKVEPEFTEEARRAKLQGTVVLHIEVNERGQPQNISVRQSLGLGLDERAIEAVRRWRFRAGTIDGKPAVSIALVEVNFRLL